MKLKMPKYKLIREYLACQLRDGEGAHSGELPTEKNLMEQFQVGRNTVRAALRELRNDGLIHSSQGRRARVNLSGEAPRKLRRVIWLNFNESDRAEPVYMKTYNAFLREADKHNTNVLFLTLQDDADKRWLLANLEAIDGIAISGLTRDHMDAEITQALSGIKNLVAVDHPGDSPARNCICTDNYLGGRIAAEHLIRCGYRKIFVAAVIPSVKWYVPFQERLRGFFDAVMECDSPDIRVTFHSSNAADYCLDTTGYLALELEEIRNTDAIFSVTDFYALKYLDSLQALGLRVPEDIAVMGYDGTGAGEHAAPALTSIAQPVEAIGRQAFRFLADNLDGRRQDVELRIAPVLQVRGSTRTPQP